jgi:hypothetical protein
MVFPNNEIKQHNFRWKLTRQQWISTEPFGSMLMLGDSTWTDQEVVMA